MAQEIEDADAGIVLEPDSEDVEFDFYFRLVKPLVLNLPDTNDRIKAAAWIRKLKSDSTGIGLRLIYLKLLLVILQRRKLFPPFTEIPDESTPLAALPEEINIQDLVKNFLEIDKKILEEKLDHGAFGDWPLYSVACSADLTEYAASQEIPNFGVQTYFAICRDPLPQWDHFEKAVFPLGENIEILKPGWLPPPSPDISCFISPEQEATGSHKSPTRDVSGEEPPVVPKELENMTVLSPKSKEDPDKIDEFNMEPRVPPTWGSNLVNVKDSPPGRLPVAKSVFDVEAKVSEEDMTKFFNDDLDEEGRKKPMSPDQVFQAMEKSPTQRLTAEEEEELRNLEEEVFKRGQTPAVAERKSRGELGGDSFIEPGEEDFGWMEYLPEAPGFPEDEQQDPTMWESFGWWTEDPDEIFEYFPPSPRAQSTLAPGDPNAEMFARWADVPRTPDVFSKDPAVRAGKGAQRIYAIEEFGMEFFEEPVWTSAEQYLKYKTHPSPFRDPRQENRRSLKLEDYPKRESTSMRRQFTDIRGEPEEEGFFEHEPPEFADVSLQEHDVVPMTKTEALMEAIRHGPQYIGIPSPEPQPTPPKDESGEWEDIKFLEETPPLFMLEPPFLQTPPDYEPNPDVEVEPEDEISKALEEDLKIIQAKIPATTPQRSPSPKRIPVILQESPPFVSDIDVEPEAYIPSPEPVMPEKHVCPARREVDWDPNIGEAQSFYEPIKPVPMKSISDLEIISQARLRDRAARMQRPLLSPKTVPSPPPMPTLVDAPISRRLPSPMKPEILPPPGWDYQTPPSLKRQRPYIPLPRSTPTGISPPRPISQEITMFFESPPEEMFSPTEAVSALMFSPDQDFGKEPSPVRSPGGTPAAEMYQAIEDAVGMEREYPTEFEGLETEREELFSSPEWPPSPSPEKKAWLESIKEHERTPFIDKTFKIRPKPGRSYKVVRSKRPSLPDLAETSPGSPGTSMPDSTPADESRLAEERRLEEERKQALEDEIAALEAELFDIDQSFTPRSRPPSGDGESPPTPEIERRMWQESVRLHEPEFPKRSVRIPSKAPSLPTVPGSPRYDLMDERALTAQRIKERGERQQQELELQRVQAEREVERDAEAMKNVLTNQWRYKATHWNWPGYNIMFWADNAYYNIKRDRAKALLPKSPPFTWSPPRTPPPTHLLDQPIPEGLDLAPSIMPPSGWTYKTPPKYKQKIIPKRKITIPTGISPPKPISQSVTMFFESPPDGMLSPSEAVSAIMHSPEEGFGKEPSPVRSPGGTPAAEIYQAIEDAVGMEKEYPTEFEGLETETEDLFTSPEWPPSPSPEKKAWLESIKEHDRTPFTDKAFKIRPTPGRSYEVVRSKRPSLPDLAETSPGSPDTSMLDPTAADLTELEEARKQALEAEIAALEAELFDLDQSFTPRSRPPSGDGESPPTPDIERRMWQESVRLHEPEFPKRSVRTPSRPPRLPTVSGSPRYDLMDERALAAQRRKERGERQKQELELQRLEAARQVEKDAEAMKKVLTNQWRYKATHWNWPGYNIMLWADNAYYNIKRDRAKALLPKSPPFKWSPPRTPPPTHLLDQPIPEGLDLAPSIMPPSGWTYKTPPKYKQKIIPKRKITIPTGISPPKKISQSVTMFFESPPDGMLSPSEAVSAIMHSPEEGFGKEPSPVRSPGGRPAAEIYQPIEDAVGMEREYPTEFEGLETETEDLFTSPEWPPSPSPEKKAWLESIKEHERTPFTDKTFNIRPTPGRSYEVVRSKRPSLPDLAETSPDPTAADLTELEEARKQALEAEIAALEAELFDLDQSFTPRSRPPSGDGGSPPTPDIERRMWQESVRLHEPEFPKRYVRTPSRPPRLPTVSGSPRYDLMDERALEAQRRKERGERQQQELELQRLEAARQVERDAEAMKNVLTNQWRYKATHWNWPGYNIMLWADNAYYNIKRDRAKALLPKSPPFTWSPPRTPPPTHLLDQPIPEGLDLAPSIMPPSGWTYKTPPKYKQKIIPKRKITIPTGISPPKRISRSVTMFFESPPDGMLSPSEAVSAIMHSPEEGFGKEPSPVRSPGGRPAAEIYQPIEDAVGMEREYPTEFEGLETESEDLFTSPEWPPSPSPEKKAWLESIREHERTPFTDKTFKIRPKPGRSYKVVRSRRPSLPDLEETSPDPTAADLTELEEARKQALEAEIAALEAELFEIDLLTSPRRRPPSGDGESPPTPDIERRMWQESVRLHEPEFPKGYFRTPSRPPRLPTVSGSPRYDLMDERALEAQRRKERGERQKQELELQRLEAARQVERDAEAMKKVLTNQWRYKATHWNWPGYNVMLWADNAYYNIKRDRAKALLPKSPPFTWSPPRTPPPTHLLDQPIPEGLDLAPSIMPPSGWTYKTPPKYKQKIIPKRKITIPTGISPPKRISRSVTMYFESPPDGMLSPSEAVSAIMHSPEEGFGKEPSPVRSPGGRPAAEIYQTIEDAVGLESEYPSEFEGLETETEDLFTSPEWPPSPSPEKKAWLESIREHERTPFTDKTFKIRPKPGRSYEVVRSRRPSLPDLEETSPGSPDTSMQDPTAADLTELQEAKKLQLEAEIAALEAELFDLEELTESSIQPCPSSVYSPETPEHEREAWRQQLALRELEDYPKRTFVVKPKPGKSYKVSKGRRPRLDPVKEKYLEWSPVSPPMRPRSYTSEGEFLPHVSKTPEGWTWKTPSPWSKKPVYMESVTKIIPEYIITPPHLGLPYIETPIPPGTRPWKRQRQPLKLTRTRLVFDDEEETPDDSALYSEDIPDYEVRPSFEGQPDYPFTDTSMIEQIEELPEEERDFRWMRSKPRCPWGKK